jgi:hypothetical protein
MYLKKKQILLLTAMSLFMIRVQAQKWGLYTFYSSQNSSTAYLVDTTGTTYKTWTFSSTKKTGYSSYLIPGDTIVRSVAYTGNVLSGGGITGEVQKVDWNGNVVWDFVYSTSTYCIHHDICPMPNGNVLLISYDVKTAADATLAGCSTSIVIQSEKIIEVKPTGATTGTIVWEWRVWDHLCQNVNSAKNNYVTSVVQHPELLNINYNTTKDWLHMNGIDYNAELDQITLSSHMLNEMYVIDHSTTTAQAATHTGGRSVKGGDFLYRWGNPAAYGATGTTIFNVVHDAHWVPKDCPRAGYLSAFNNKGGTSSKSCIDIIAPPYDTVNIQTMLYKITLGSAYNPTTYTYRYTTNFSAQDQGNSQQLPNGNMLICNPGGSIFEINPAGTTLWTKTVSGGATAMAFRYSKCYVRAPNAFASAAFTAVCSGKPVTLNSSATSISESNPVYGYAWSSVPAGFTSTLQNPVINPTSTSTYKVIITNTNIGCSDTASVTIHVNPLPVKPTITPLDSTSFCTGDSVQLQAPAGYSYIWSTKSTSRQITVKSSGKYSVTVIDNNSCSSPASDSIIVKADNGITKPQIQITGSNSFCIGDSVVLSAPVGYTYTWSTKDTLRKITVKNKGKYAVIITAANGCSSPPSDSVKVSVYPDITKPQIQISGSNPFCNGDSAILSGPAGYTYLWSNSAITQSITVKSTGAFRLKISQSGCPSNWSDTLFTDILSGASKPVITIHGNTQLCKGDSVILTGPPGFRYLWSNNDTTMGIIIKNSGKFTLRITKETCISDLSDIIEIIRHDIPVISISMLPEKCVNGEIIKLNDFVTVDGNHISTGIWSSPCEGLIFGDSFNPIAAGVNSSPGWKVKYEYTNPSTGCYNKDSSFIRVFSFPASPVILAVPDSTFCQGDSILLTAPTGYPGYLWSVDSLSIQSISLDYSDTVFLQIADANGCKNSGGIIVTERVKPPKPVVTDSLSYLRCSVPGSNYFWFKREMSPEKILLPLQTRTINPKSICTNCYYSVIIADSFGCLSDTSDELLFKGTSINNLEKSSVSIFPNPASDKLNIEGNILDINTFEVLILNSCSQIIKQQKNTKTVDISELNNGLYIIQLKIGNSQSTYKRLIISK